MTESGRAEGTQNRVWAKYYSGVRPAAQEVEVILLEDGIEVLDPQGVRVSHWDFYLLQRHSYDGRSLIVKWGRKDPFEYLEISDPDFIKSLDASQKHKSLLSGKGISLEWFTLGRLSVWIIGLLLFFGLLYYFMVPSLVGFVANRIPVEWEKRWAGQSASLFVDTSRIDLPRTELMNGFYDRLGHASHYDIRIFVLRDTVVNAFAMPGGILVLHTAMLDRLSAYPQLVGLLGHEIAHVEKRHSLKAMVKSLGGLVLIQVLFGGFDLFSGLILDQLRTFESLAYSRSLEQEADQQAVEFCMNAQVDPRGIIGLFEILKDVEADHQFSVPGFLRTHPLTEDRIAHTSQLIEIKSDAFVPNYQPALDSLFCEIKGLR